MNKNTRYTLFPQIYDFFTIYDFRSKIKETLTFFINFPPKLPKNLQKVQKTKHYLKKPTKMNVSQRNVQFFHFLHFADEKNKEMLPFFAQKKNSNFFANFSQLFFRKFIFCTSRKTHKTKFRNIFWALEKSPFFTIFETSKNPNSHFWTFFRPILEKNHILLFDSAPKKIFISSKKSPSGRLFFFFFTFKSHGEPWEKVLNAN